MAKLGQPSPQSQAAPIQQQLQQPVQQQAPPVQQAQYQQPPFDPNVQASLQYPPQNGQYQSAAAAPPQQYVQQPTAPPQQFQPPVAGPVSAPVVAPPQFGGQIGAAVAGPSAQQMLGGIDFGNVSEGNFILLPLTYADGNPVFYEAVIDKIDQKPSNAGAPMVTLKLKVTFPEFVGNVRVIGASLNDNVTFSDAALWKLKGLLRSCGLLSDDNRTSLLKDWSELIGNILRFQTRHDEFEKDGNKETRSKVSSGYSEGYETPGLSGAPTTAPQPAPTVAQPMQPAAPQQYVQQPPVTAAFGQPLAPQTGPNFGLNPPQG